MQLSNNPGDRCPHPYRAPRVEQLQSRPCGKSIPRKPADSSTGRRQVGAWAGSRVPVRRVSLQKRLTSSTVPSGFSVCWTNPSLVYRWMFFVLRDPVLSSIRSQELARASVQKMGWSRSRLSRQAGRMEARELIRRDPDPADGRGCLLVLAPLGLDALRGATAVHLESVRRRFADRLDARDLLDIVRISGKLAHAPEPALRHVGRE